MRAGRSQQLFHWEAPRSCTVDARRESPGISLTSVEHAFTAKRVALWLTTCAVLDEAMYGTKDAAQCFDVASEKRRDGDRLHHSWLSHLSVQTRRRFCGVRHKTATKTISKKGCPNISSSCTLQARVRAQHLETPREICQTIRTQQDVNVWSTKLTHDMLS